MHLFLMTRGIQQSRDIWKKFMETQMFNWIRRPVLKDSNNKFLKNPDGSYQLGNPEYSKVQGALRPLEFWEYVLPEECVPEALGMMNLQNAFPLRPEVNNFAWIMRKLLHAKKIPQELLDSIKGKQMWDITQKYVPMQGMAVYPIGIKADKKHVFTWDEGTKDATGYEQEGL